MRAKSFVSMVPALAVLAVLAAGLVQAEVRPLVMEDVSGEPPAPAVAAVAELFPIQPGVNAERGFAVALDGDRLAVGARLDGEAPCAHAGAVYLFTWDLTFWRLDEKLVAAEPRCDGQFGSAVALRDGVLVAGAIGEGAAYVFVEEEGAWVQARRLTGSAAHGPGVFGRAVAVDGDRVAVGAVPPHGREAGAVYLFAAPEWDLERRLSSPAPADPRERFGEALAMRGGLLAVGAPGRSCKGASRAGAVHVFTPAAVFTLQAEDCEEGDQLGAAVATDGETLAAGAPGHHGPRGNAGAAYAAACAAGGCGPLELLTDLDLRSADRLGSAVAVDGDVVAAGAPGPAPGDPAGEVRVYHRVGSTWTWGIPLRPDNAEGGDLAGFAVALDRGRLAIGAATGNQASAAAGAAWSLRYDPQLGWAQEGEAAVRDPLAGLRVGVSVAASEEYLVVGALREAEGDASPGAVYVYRRAGKGWRQDARLVSPAGVEARDGFGSSVAIDGTSVLVGAPVGIEVDGGPLDGPGPARGAAYLFVRQGGSWRLEEPFYPADPAPGEIFAAAVALEGDAVVIGAPRLGAPGAVYAAERLPAGWAQTGFFRSPQVLAADEPDGFGAALALRRGTLVVGAPGTPAEPPAPDPPAVVLPASTLGTLDAGFVGHGAAFVSRRLTGGRWSAPVRLPEPSATPHAHERIGAAVAAGDFFLAVGAPGESLDAGAVYTFQPDGDSWISDTVSTDELRDRLFGSAVAVRGDLLLVGSPGRGPFTSGDFDQAYLFRRLGGEGWSAVAAVDAVRAPVGDRFGAAVTLTGRFFAVTGPGSARGDRVTLFTLGGPEEETP